MIEIGHRMRNQPAPPHAVFEALTEPNRDGGRTWLDLLDDEQLPRITAVQSRVIWSALWLKRPDAVIEFDLLGREGGTDLRWRLYVDEPVPAAALVGHMRKRVNELINADLRYSFGNSPPRIRQGFALPERKTLPNRRRGVRGLGAS